MKKNTNKSKIVLVSNTSWYLYNFRIKLLFLIKSYNYDLFLICPEDEYTEKLTERDSNWNNGERAGAWIGLKSDASGNLSFANGEVLDKL